MQAVGDLLSSAPNRGALRPVIDAYFGRWAEFDPKVAIEATKDADEDAKYKGKILKIN